MDSIKKPPTGGFFTFYNYLLSHPPYSLFVIPWLDHGIQVSQINCLNTAVRCLSIHITTHRHPDVDREPLCITAKKSDGLGWIYSIQPRCRAAISITDIALFHICAARFSFHMC